MFLGAALEALIEQVAYPLNFSAGEPLDHTGEVFDPDLVKVGPIEQLDSLFKYPEGLFVEIVSLQEPSEVQDGFGCSNLCLDDSLVSPLGVFELTTVLKQIDVEAPCPDIVGKTAST